MLCHKNKNLKLYTKVFLFMNSFSFFSFKRSLLTPFNVGEIKKLIKINFRGRKLVGFAYNLLERSSCYLNFPYVLTVQVDFAYVLRCAS